MIENRDRITPTAQMRRGRLVVDKRAAGTSVVGDACQPRVFEWQGRLVRRKEVASKRDEPTFVAGDPVVNQPTGKVEAVFITIFVIMLFVPVSWNLGALRLPPYLLFIALAFVPVLVIWLQRKKTPLILPDILMLGFCGWAAVAMLLSLDQPTEPIGVQFLSTFGAYLVGRVLVRDVRSMRRLVATAAIAFTVLIPTTSIEVFTGQKPLLQIARFIGTPVGAVVMDKRLGLERAQGAFEHPILMGVLAASLASLIFYSFRERRFRTMRWVTLPAAVLSCLFTLSTGALLSLNIQIFLMLWSRLLRLVTRRWRLLSVILITLYIAVDFISTKTPFHVFVNYATFSSGSSYNRILIWQFGSAEALRHPFFGIGPGGDWTRPPWMHASMDNFWLVQAVRYGLPAFVLLATSIIMILWRMGKVAYVSEELILMRRGVTFSVIGTLVAILSVHLWNASYVWFIFLIGASGWMATPAGIKPTVAKTRTF